MILGNVCARFMYSVCRAGNACIGDYSVMSKVEYKSRLAVDRQRYRTCGKTGPIFTATLYLNNGGLRTTAGRRRRRRTRRRPAETYARVTCGIILLTFFFKFT